MAGLLERLEQAGIGKQLRERLLAVPVYQRPFSWERDQVEEFLQDIGTSMERTPPGYFLGTIVLTARGSGNRDTVIDGQQRLATTAMAFAAIRDELLDRSATRDAGIIERQFLLGEELGAEEPLARLRLSAEDDSFFLRRILRRDESIAPLRRSHHRMVNAYACAREFFRGHVGTHGTDATGYLTRWAAFVQDSARVVVLEVASDADAFFIFETLNDRGADLTIADLLKNFLFGKAGEQIAAVQASWQAALNVLEIAEENKAVTTFIRHFWISKKGAIRERELYKNIKDNVATSAQAVEFADELARAARLYSAILNPDHDFWTPLGTEARENVRVLMKFDLEQYRPLLLSAMQHLQQSELKRLLRALVSWAVRGVIVGGIGGGTYERVYCAAAVKIRNGEIKQVDELFGELSAIVPTDEDFKGAFMTLRVPLSKSQLARYYLCALERGLAGESQPELVPNEDEDKVNLEHIFPKTPVEADWAASFPKDERRSWLTRLGNLALVSKSRNIRLGNRAFADKRETLAESEFEWTKRVANESAWNPAAIATRQSSMAESAIEIWRRLAR